LAEFDWLSALLGGSLIGLAATLLLAGSGRIAGISGIVGEIIAKPGGAGVWRYLFVAGLLGGAFLHQSWTSTPVVPRTDFPILALLAGGALVGIGTRLGGGCTSGHGVCGLARQSARSLVATLIFLGTAMGTVWFIRHGGGGIF